MDAQEYVSAGAARTARWRAAVKRRSIPETDDLDTAIASAFSAFIGHYQRSGLMEHQQAADGMVRLIGKALQDAGYCGDEAIRRAENRLFYLQMVSRYPDASAKAKRRWELGPPDPEAAIMEHDFDATYEGEYDPTDEDAYDD
ncbi:hypothetical protein [Rhizobium sp. Leaf311]|uniref:hypothetical protein n=1 Tax=Rhizobium sp. Leaf311 TaxID=1736332 RepID=UPI0007871EA6|nr:hypothetical protein [Rhizobium sp. Leaf311]